MPATRDDHPHTAARPGPILVFGATGQQGGAVACALAEAGWQVRALVRDPEGPKADTLKARDVTLCAGTFDDTLAIRAAMRGAFGVFSVQPSSGQGSAYGITDAQEIAWGTRIAELARDSGVRHLVYSSSNAVGRGPTGVGHFDSKAEIERHLAGLALSSTVVRPAAFMELLLLPGMGLDQNRFSFFLRPDQTAQVIAVRDIGRIVARIFARHDDFAGQAIEIASDALTGAQLAAALGDAAGRPIRYERFPDALLDGDPFLGRLAGLVDDGRLAGHADLARLDELFGPLTRFNSWLDGPGRTRLRMALDADGGSLMLR